MPSDTQLMSWLIIGFIAAWGGLVRYLIDIQNKQCKWNWINVLCQLIISCFTGILGGLLSFESGGSPYMTFAIAGLFGTTGSSGLNWIWRRLFMHYRDDGGKQ
ncbi:phage holin family protein [Photorhabdus sp. P32]|nr:phage holin family protein [Photorhabdus luminescens]MCW7763188.1 phage holin family protein [Photorhabdus luminescens subsp. venezuelensis]